jgi:hypothetical protein
MNHHSGTVDKVARTLRISTRGVRFDDGQFVPALLAQQLRAK